MPQPLDSSIVRQKGGVPQEKILFLRLPKLIMKSNYEN